MLNNFYIAMVCGFYLTERNGKLLWTDKWAKALAFDNTETAGQKIKEFFKLHPDYYKEWVIQDKYGTVIQSGILKL